MASCVYSFSFWNIVMKTFKKKMLLLFELMSLLSESMILVLSLFILPFHISLSF